jgi:hypothetical protein
MPKKTVQSRRTSRKAPKRKSRVPPRAPAGERPSVYEYHPSIIVKFRDETTLPYMDGLETFLRSKKLGKPDRLEQIYPKIRFERLYTLPEEKIRQFIRRAVAGDPTYRPRNLLNYFVLRVPDRAPLQELIDELVSWDIVETAVVTPPISDPKRKLFAESSDGGRSSRSHETGAVRYRRRMRLEHARAETARESASSISKEAGC